MTTFMLVIIVILVVLLFGIGRLYKSRGVLVAELTYQLCGLEAKMEDVNVLIDHKVGEIKEWEKRIKHLLADDRQAAQDVKDAREASRDLMKRAFEMQLDASSIRKKAYKLFDQIDKKIGKADSFRAFGGVYEAVKIRVVEPVERHEKQDRQKYMGGELHEKKLLALKWAIANKLQREGVLIITTEHGENGATNFVGEVIVGRWALEEWPPPTEASLDSSPPFLTVPGIKNKGDALDVLETCGLPVGDLGEKPSKRAIIALARKYNISFPGYSDFVRPLPQEIIGEQV